MTRSFAINAIDMVIHGKIRLGAMAYLASHRVASFSDLKAALETTDGNLSINMQKLEAAGYVSMHKSFTDRRPVTRYSITETGRAAFARYLDVMSTLIGDEGN
ncbi:MAG: transcriptional regulator [Sphingobium sp.]|nr:transcriptional regulator [Sphingobium sp.]